MVSVRRGAHVWHATHNKIMKSTSTCSKYVCRYIVTSKSLYCDLPSRYIATSYVVILRLTKSLYCDFVCR